MLFGSFSFWLRGGDGIQGVLSSLVEVFGGKLWQKNRRLKSGISVLLEISREIAARTINYVKDLLGELTEVPFLPLIGSDCIWSSWVGLG